MKMKLFGFNNEIVFTDSHVNILEISNINFFQKVVKDFNDFYNGTKDDNEIVLIDDEGKSLNMSKNIMTIIDVFNIDFNSKKILNKLYEKISRNIRLESSINEEYNNSIQNVIRFIRNIVNDLSFDYEMKEVLQPEDILKILSLKIDTNYYETLQEKIFFLFDIISEFNLTNILIIPNLKTFIDSDDIIEIYKYAKIKKINLLLIEKGISEKILSYEKKILIDEEYDDFLIK